MGPFARVPPSQLRVSDAERREVADLLARHFADGRLDQAELDERIDRAMAAKTRADLGGLLTDLPSLDADAAPSAPPAAPLPALRRGRPRVRVLGALLLLLLAFDWLRHTLFWHNWWWPGGPGFGPFRPHVGVLVIALVAVVLWRRVARRRRVRPS